MIFDKGQMMNLRQRVKRSRRIRSHRRLTGPHPGQLHRLKRRLQRMLDMIEDQLREQEKQLAADTPFQVNGDFDDMPEFDTEQRPKAREASLTEAARKAKSRAENQE